MVHINKYAQNLFDLTYSLKSLEKFITYLKDKDRIEDFFSMEELLRFLSRTRITELIDKRVFLPYGDTFFFSTSLTRNLIIEEEEAAGSHGVSQPREGEKMGNIPSSYEDSLKERQLISLMNNFSMSRIEVLSLLEKDQDMRVIFNLPYSWVECSLSKERSELNANNGLSI
jgi:hypothetical protein